MCQSIYQSKLFLANIALITHGYFIEISVFRSIHILIFYISSRFLATLIVAADIIM